MPAMMFMAFCWWAMFVNKRAYVSNIIDLNVSINVVLGLTVIYWTGGSGTLCLSTCY
jgi:hypothetical protein